VGVGMVGRKHAQSGNSNSCGNDRAGGDNAAGSNEKVCNHCGIPGHIRPNSIHYKRGKETQNRFPKGTAPIATTGDRDLI